MQQKIELPNGVVITIDGNNVSVDAGGVNYFQADDSGPVTPPPNSPGH